MTRSKLQFRTFSPLGTSSRWEPLMLWSWKKRANDVFVELLGTSRKPRQWRRRERSETKDVMNKTIALHVRLKLWSLLRRLVQNKVKKLRQKFSHDFTLNSTLNLYFLPNGRCRTVRNGKRVELLTKFLGDKEVGFFRQRFPTLRRNEIWNSIIAALRGFIGNFPNSLYSRGFCSLGCKPSQLFPPPTPKGSFFWGYVALTVWKNKEILRTNWCFFRLVKFFENCNFLCEQDRPELTPVAIRAGKLLADRLFGGSDVTMDYDKVCHRSTMDEPSFSLFSLFQAFS